MRRFTFSLLILLILSATSSLRAQFPPLPKPPSPPTVPVPRPDLVVTQVTANAPSFWVNDEIRLTVSIKNIDAGGATKSNFRVTLPEGFTMAGPPTLPPGFSPCTNQNNTVLTCKAQDSAPPLLYNQTHTAEFRLRTSSPGTKSIHVQADALSLVGETSETNNGGTGSFQVKERPKLKVTAGGPATPRLANQSFGMWCTMNNIGTVAANTYLYIFIESTNTLSLTNLTSDCNPMLTLPWKDSDYTISCNPRVLQPGGSRAVSVSLQGQSASVRMKCRVEADGENTPADNESIATATIN